MLHAHADNLLDDEDFLLLSYLNTSKNPDFEYWNYDPFDLRSMPDAECFTEMTFWKNDIDRLANALNMPEEITCHFYNDLIVGKIEALCVLLKRLSYPCRYSDMIHCFGRPVPQLCMIFNQMVDYVDSAWGYILSDWN